MKPQDSIQVLFGLTAAFQIFKLQTGTSGLIFVMTLVDKLSASFRADLPDFAFEFIQGTVPHTEGI